MVEKLSISEAFEMYRNDYISFKGQSIKTEESYRVAKSLLLRMYGDIPICELTFAHVRDWKNWLSGWQKPDTVRNNIICLRVVLKFLLSRACPVMNPELIPVPRREARMVEFLTEEEVADFIAEAGRSIRGYNRINRMRNVAIITLLYSTGLRVSELCSLNRNSIRDRTFTVIGKGAKTRICFIDVDTEKVINRYLEHRTDDCPALFISDQTCRRITPDTIRKMFKNICERSDFNHVHPHTIRHSYATKLLRRRVDIRYIGDLMGHVSLDTTKVYTHVVNEDLKAIYDAAHAKTLDISTMEC